MINLSEKCRWLHIKLESLPLIKYPFRTAMLPRSGIYFFYEKGESWGHGDDRLRIVRVGTHRKANFRSRISEHFLPDESKMKFGVDKPKPSDRSIFRKNIGRALLNRNRDPYLEIWEIDFIAEENRERYGHLRDIEKEREVEESITRIMRENFCFRFLIFEHEIQRIGSRGLEAYLIGTVAKCKLCAPSPDWLGRYSPKNQVRASGLWLAQHLTAGEIGRKDMGVIEIAIQETKDWIANGG